MDNLTKKIHKVINEFNKYWDLDLEISRIIYWNESGAQYTWHKSLKGWIYLNPNQTFSKIKEDIFHELGHAIIHQYLVTNKDLRIFRNDSLNMSRSTVQNKEDWEEEPPYGFVSWYATVNGTEDFCETLSAWASNGYKVTGVYYGDFKIPVKQEPKLLKKFLQVEQILLNL